MRCPKALWAVIALVLILALAGEACTALRVVHIRQDASGTWNCSVLSDYVGSQPTTVRILWPTNPPPADRPHRILYILPVEVGVTDLKSRYGDGFEQARLLDLHNRYNVTLVAPSFPIEPWYGDHPSDPTRKLESFLVRDLVPWVDTMVPSWRPPERWLVGFSKSASGALSLIFRHPQVFSAAAAWDVPAQLKDLSRFASMRENFGTEENFASYQIPRLVAERGGPFRARNRLWISGDVSAWHTDVEALHKQMTAAGVRHTYTGGTAREHHWSSGWLAEAVAYLDTTTAAPSLLTAAGPTCLSRVTAFPTHNMATASWDNRPGAGLCICRGHRGLGLLSRWRCR